MPRASLLSWFRLCAVAACLPALPVIRGQVSSSSPGGTGSTAETGARPAPHGVFGTAPTQGPAGQPLKLSPVFFPAMPPVLETELPPAPSIRDGIWVELAPFTHDLFYAPLGTRLSEGNLNRRHRQRLEAFRTERDAALAELLAALDQPASRPAGREAALAALAARLDPRLAALTTAADELRRDLYTGSFLVSDADWNQHRDWRLGREHSKRTPQEILYDEFSVLRAAIYYQEGLAPAQRQLLREVVIELAAALGEREPAGGDAFAPSQIIFFLPHGARLRLPSDLPADLARDLAVFTATKARLRRELRDALFTFDPESRVRRERALQELAARQAPELAALEPQAERIRLALAALPAEPQPTARPGLDPALTARIENYLREKGELQDAARREAQAPPANAARRRPDTQAQRAALAEFEERHRARLAVLADEARAIRTEVAQATAAASEPAVKSVDALLADFALGYRLRQLQSLHLNYRRAVLAPGLSPAQRDLLFGAALAAFALPGVKDWQAVPE